MKLKHAWIIPTILFFSISFLASLPQVQAAISYSWNDSTSTVTISGSGTMSLTTLRNYDRGRSKSHLLLDWSTVPYGGSFQLNHPVRPADDMAIKVWLNVQSFGNWSVLTISGLDYHLTSTAISETINITANGWVQTTNSYKAISGITSSNPQGSFQFQVWQDRWGIVGQFVSQGVVSADWILQGGIIIQSGVTFTITSTAIACRLISGDTGIHPTSYIRVDSGAVMTFGALADAATKSVYQGTAIFLSNYMDDPQHQAAIFNNGGALNFYGCFINNVPADYYTFINSSGTTKIYGSTLVSIMLQGQTYDLYNVFEESPYTGLQGNFYPIVGTFTNLYFTKATSCILVNDFSPDLTFRNLYSRNATYLIFEAQSATYYTRYAYIIDGDIDYWRFFFSIDFYGKIYREYSFDLAVTYPNGTTYQNANVTITYSGMGGGKVGSWLTDANGQIPTQVLVRGFYNWTQGNTMYDYAPYNLTITSSYGNYSQIWIPTSKEFRKIALTKGNPVISSNWNDDSFVTGIASGGITIGMIGFAAVIGLIAVQRKKKQEAPFLYRRVLYVTVPNS